MVSLKKYDQAINQFKKALSISPENVMILEPLSLTYN